MSDKDLDKLFKTKLEELNTNPSPQAWDRISEEIGGSRKGMVWWRAAAAVVLLVSIIGLVQWNLSDNSTPQLASQDTTIVEPAKDDNSEEATSDAIEKAQETLPQIKQEEQLAIAEDIEDINSQREEAKNKNNPVRQEPIAQQSAQDNKEEQNSNNILEETNETIAMVETPDAKDQIESSFPTEEEIAEVATVASVQGTTRSFSIEQFGNAQRSDVTEEVESQDKEEKGLKKIWNLLRQVKEPENGLGDLREMKNGLFAFGKSKKESDNQ